MFWDASAVVPLAFTEPRSTELLALAEIGKGLFTIWWSTPVECCAASYQKQRLGRVGAAELKHGLQRLRDTFADAHIVAPTEALRHRAEQLLAVHALRAADVLQ